MKPKTSLSDNVAPANLKSNLKFQVLRKRQEASRVPTEASIALKVWKKTASPCVQKNQEHPAPRRF